MWRHLLHYPIIKKSVFAQEQLLGVLYLGGTYFQLISCITSFSYGLISFLEAMMATFILMKRIIRSMNEAVEGTYLMEGKPKG